MSQRFGTQADKSSISWPSDKYTYYIYTYIYIYIYIYVCVCFICICMYIYMIIYVLFLPIRNLRAYQFDIIWPTVTKNNLKPYQIVSDIPLFFQLRLQVLEPSPAISVTLLPGLRFSQGSLASKQRFDGNPRAPLGGPRKSNSAQHRVCRSPQLDRRNLGTIAWLYAVVLCYKIHA